MLLYPIFFKKEIRHTHFFPLFPLFPLNRYISLRFIFFSRHHDMQRLFLIFDDDFCVSAAKFAVQRPRDGIVEFKADRAGLRGDEIVHAHGQQGEERAECINRHVGIGVGKCCFACAEPLKKRSFQQ